MILERIFKIIDQLTPEQKQQVKQYIDQQPDTLHTEINAILATAQPIPLQAGTMKIDQLLVAAQEMWTGLDEAEIETIIQTMNAESIEPDTTYHQNGELVS
jgi:hypothetical protein